MKKSEGGICVDNEKMGRLIREARKEKGLTQLDVARKFGITDRAVSKWERGICAPDIGILEQLAELLGLSVAELISGERKPAQEHREAVDAAVKETISYSRKEITAKKKAAAGRLAAVSVLAGILAAAVLLGVLWYRGSFHRVGRYPSPDGTTVTTVYGCCLGNGKLPSAGGFTLEDQGRFRGRTIYEYATFRGLWWSPNGSYQVVSMDTDEGVYLSLTDFTRNIGVNLTFRLETSVYGDPFFSDVPYNKEGWKPQITFEFLQWSQADPEKMQVFFSYTDTKGSLREGYLWYDYETGKSYGQMEIEQGEKTADPLYGLIGELLS